MSGDVSFRLPPGPCVPLTRGDQASIEADHWLLHQPAQDLAAYQGNRHHKDVVDKLIGIGGQPGATALPTASSQVFRRYRFGSAELDPRYRSYRRTRNFRVGLGLRADMITPLSVCTHLFACGSRESAIG